MPALTLFSFAKINLVLRVLRKRPDRYHDIETIMQTVDLTDTLTFSPVRSGISVTCTAPDVPVDERNLAYKAAQLLRERYGCRKGVRIHIDKRIPVAGGLAGGSGNAAMTLHALNRLWKLDLNRETLLGLSAELGSDVPFCLFGGMAAGEGRGERLTRLNSKSKEGFLLVNPACAVSSAWAYRNANLELTNVMSCINLDVSVWQGSDFQRKISHLYNDLESAVCAAYPMVEQARLSLKKCGAAGVLMSGSGPTVFGVFPDRADAEAARQRLIGHIEPAWRMFVVSPVSHEEVARRSGWMER
ncbi:MAG: 4-(cytidine 5'-diphospho)-2-C-methyl-D-erythritol kinase [candidate division Zixibacteria bacterium]|nr:4-(cytidine 5'-diphospho)-2-C-methyl-D-erythritol kinase [candidate division Zixibacteria bacterium]